MKNPRLRRGEQVVTPVYSLRPMDNNLPRHLPHQLARASNMTFKIPAPGGAVQQALARIEVAIYRSRREIEAAVDGALNAGSTTLDIGGTLHTDTMANAVIAQLPAQ